MNISYDDREGTVLYAVLYPETPESTELTEILPVASSRHADLKVESFHKRGIPARKMFRVVTPWIDWEGEDDEDEDAATEDDR